MPTKRRRSFVGLFSKKNKEKKTSVNDIQHNIPQIVDHEPDVQIRHLHKNDVQQYMDKTNVCTNESIECDNVSTRSVSPSKVPFMSTGWTNNKNTSQVQNIISSLPSSRIGMLLPIDNKPDKNDNMHKKGSKQKKMRKDQDIIQSPKPCFGSMYLDEVSSLKDFDCNDHETYIDGFNMGELSHLPIINTTSVICNSDDSDSISDCNRDSSQLSVALEMMSTNLDKVKTNLSPDEELHNDHQRPRRGSLFNKLFSRNKKHSKSEANLCIDGAVPNVSHKWNGKTEKQRNSNVENKHINETVTVNMDSIQIPMDTLKPRGSLGETVIESLNNIINDMDDSDGESNQVQKGCQCHNPNVECQCMDCSR